MFYLQSSSWEQCTIEHYTNTTFDQSTSIAPPPLDIPKELYALVDFIKRQGLDKVSVETHSVVLVYGYASKRSVPNNQCGLDPMVPVD